MLEPEGRFLGARGRAYCHVPSKEPPCPKSTLCLECAIKSHLFALHPVIQQAGIVTALKFHQPHPVRYFFPSPVQRAARGRGGEAQQKKGRDTLGRPEREQAENEGRNTFKGLMGETWRTMGCPGSPHDEVSSDGSCTSAVAEGQFELFERRLGGPIESAQVETGHAGVIRVGAKQRCFKTALF